MARLSRYLTFWLIVVLVSAAKSPAQSTPESVRQLSFTVFSPEEVTGIAFAADVRGGLTELKFYPTARTPRYQYRGPAKFRLFDAATGEVVAERELPASIRTALVLLFPGDSTHSRTRRYRIELIDEDRVSPKAGELRILNLSGFNLRGTVNGRSLEVGLGFNDPIRLAGSAAVDLRTIFRGRSLQAYNETLPLTANSGGLLLLLPPYREGSVELQSRFLLD